MRLRPSGQLAGFTKKDDLEYFLARLLNCQYEHVPILAPTQEIMASYRKEKDWDAYVKAFGSLLEERRIPQALETGVITDGSCLLCSKQKPERCHRRLVAERLQACLPDVEVIHLV